MKSAILVVVSPGTEMLYFTSYVYVIYHAYTDVKLYQTSKHIIYLTNVI